MEICDLRNYFHAARDRDLFYKFIGKEMETNAVRLADDYLAESRCNKSSIINLTALFVFKTH